MATLTLADIDVALTTLPAPDISQLTTKSIDGTGVFDVLMSSAKLHLLEEYNADRITGEEYTQVYLGAMTAVLQQSVAYLLSHQNQEKVLAEIGLVRQQTVTELAKTDDTLPVGLGFNGDSSIEGLVKDEKDLNAKKQALADAEITKMTRDGVLTGQKIATELSQTDDSLSGAAAYMLNDGNMVEGIVNVSKDKIQAEVDLLVQKTTTELAQTDDATCTQGIAFSTKGKLEAEKTLLSQKTNTELAQTSDIVKTGAPYLNTSTVVTGVTQKQKELFGAQTSGFARDAEQKAAKMLLDTWSVRQSTDGAQADATNKLDDTSIGEVMTILRAGVGVV